MTTHYIAPTTHATTPGNDTTGTGSSAMPWATISKAHTMAASGDTIICKAGTYTWSNQTFSKTLTVQGESIPAYNSTAKTWGGVVFDGATVQTRWINSAAITLRNLIFTNIINTTLSVFDVNASLSLAGCVLHNINHRAYYQITPGFFDLDSFSNTLSLLGCVFFNNPTNGGTDSIESEGYISLASGSPIIVISNCVFYDAAHRHLIFLLANIATSTIIAKNNIFYSSAGIMSRLVGVFSDTNPTTGTRTFSNNTYVGWSNNQTDANANASSPQFIDPANGDFNIRPGSPAVNSGVAL